MKKALLIFVLGMVGFMAVVRAKKEINLQARHITEQQKYIAELESHVPIFEELQEMVGAEEDGIIGPNTIEKWDKAICNQEAVKMFERMAGVKE